MGPHSLSTVRGCCGGTACSMRTNCAHQDGGSPLCFCSGLHMCCKRAQPVPVVQMCPGAAWLGEQRWGGCMFASIGGIRGKEGKGSF